MDQYNVIQLTSNIDDLNNDMVKWSNMPYDRRLRSDENCIRLYGMTNIELYNKLKAVILYNTEPADPELIGSMISESADFSIEKADSFFNMEDFEWRLSIAEDLNKSPIIAIISPHKGISTEELAQEVSYIYNKYIGLNDKDKRFSNSYSIELWGYNVPNMYIILSDMVQTNDATESNDKLICTGESASDLFFRPIQESVDNMILNNDKIGLLKVKLDNLSEKVTIRDKINTKSINEEIDNGLKYDFDYALPAITPFFTPGELNNTIIDSYKGEIVTSENYSSILKSAIKDYKLNPTEENGNILLGLGWIPGLDFNAKNVKVARERNVKWFNKNHANIIDLTKFKVNTNTILNESTPKMRKMYKDNELYPVYIVLTYTNSLFSKIIRKVKSSKFTHAGLTLDSDLSKILTFKFDIGANNGFTVENLDKYISIYKDTLISVMAVFVDKATKKALDKSIQYYIESKEKTKYNFGNLIDILRNKAKDNDPENLSMVCSQFVDTLLKLSGIDITDKSSNLVIPQDFQNISNPKIFKLYEGLAREYNEKNIENIIFELFKNKTRKQILYSKLVDELEDSYTIESFDYTITDNTEANKVLDEINYLLTPEAVIYERKVITVSDDGKVTIKLMKSLEQEYQEAHKLLTTYSEDNLEGIKAELARLFYLNGIIEKKIKKMKKDDPNYKELINLRARILNDFKKYLKVVLNKEPDFNFQEYYQKSEYGDKIEIDKDLLKYLGDLIAKILKK